MPAFARSPHFADLFRFVVDLGASSGPFLQDLRDFHEKWVDPKVRRVRLSVFGLLCEVPLANPFLKIAGLKWLYSCPARYVRDTYCEGLTLRDIRATFAVAENADGVVLAEKVLRYFHVACRDVLAKETPTERVRFLGNVDREVFAAVLGHAPVEEGRDGTLPRCEAVARAGTAFWDRLKQRGRGARLPLLTWQSVRVPSSTSAAAGPLRPRVIEYDAEGRPLSQQDVDVQVALVERFGWHSFMSTSEVTSAWREECAKSLAFFAICTCPAVVT
ncbi:MAG: hypothetical protein GY772_22970 [bacterium]|nr:hypothetical protein [bacterium]